MAPYEHQPDEVQTEFSAPKPERFPRATIVPDYDREAIMDEVEIEPLSEDEVRALAAAVERAKTEIATVGKKVEDDTERVLQRLEAEFHAQSEMFNAETEQHYRQELARIVAEAKDEASEAEAQVLDVVKAARAVGKAVAGAVAEGIDMAERKLLPEQYKRYLEKQLQDLPNMSAEQNIALAKNMIVAGQEELLVENLDRFHGLSAELAYKILASEGGENELLLNLKSFNGLDTGIAERIKDQPKDLRDLSYQNHILEWIDNFRKSDQLGVVAMTLRGNDDTLGKYSEILQRFSVDQVEFLIDKGAAIRSIASSIEKFPSADRLVVAKKIIEKSGSDDSRGIIAAKIRFFSPADHPLVANLLIAHGGLVYVAEYIQGFEGVDQKEIFKKILAERYLSCERFIDKFRGLDTEIAKQLRSRAGSVFVLEHLDSFTDLSFEFIKDFIWDQTPAKELALIIEHFSSLNASDQLAIGELLIKKGHRELVIQNIDKFKTADRLVVVKQLVEEDSYFVLRYAEKLSAEERLLVAENIVEDSTGYALVQPENFSKFSPSEHPALVDLLVKNFKKCGEVFFSYFDWFQGINHPEVIKRLIDQGESMSLVMHAGVFSQKDRSLIAELLIEDKKGEDLLYYLPSFGEVSHVEIAERLIENGQCDVLVEKIGSLSLDLVGWQQIIPKIIEQETGGQHLLDFFQRFDAVGQSVAVAEFMKQGMFVFAVRGAYYLPLVDQGAIAKNLINAGRIRLVDRFKECLSLDPETVEQLDSRRQEYSKETMIKNMENFSVEERQKVVEQLIEESYGGFIIQNFDKIPGINYVEVLKNILKSSRYLSPYEVIKLVVDNISKIPATEHRAVLDVLVENGGKDGAGPLAANLQKFQGIDFADVAEKLIKIGGGEEVIRWVSNFQGVNQASLSQRLIEAGYRRGVLLRLDSFDIACQDAILDLLIEADSGFEEAGDFLSSIFFQSCTFEQRSKICDHVSEVLPFELITNYYFRYFSPEQKDRIFEKTTSQMSFKSWVEVSNKLRVLAVLNECAATSDQAVKAIDFIIEKCLPSTPEFFLESLETPVPTLEQRVKIADGLIKNFLATNPLVLLRYLDSDYFSPVQKDEIKEGVIEKISSQTTAIFWLNVSDELLVLQNLNTLATTADQIKKVTAYIIERCLPEKSPFFLSHLDSAAFTPDQRSSMANYLINNFLPTCADRSSLQAAVFMQEKVDCYRDLYADFISKQLALLGDSSKRGEAIKICARLCQAGDSKLLSVFEAALVVGDKTLGGISMATAIDVLIKVDLPAVCSLLLRICAESKCSAPQQKQILSGLTISGKPASLSPSVWRSLLRWSESSFPNPLRMGHQYRKDAPVDWADLSFITALESIPSSYLRKLSEESTDSAMRYFGKDKSGAGIHQEWSEDFSAIPQPVFLQASFLCGGDRNLMKKIDQVYGFISKSASEQNNLTQAVIRAGELKGASLDFLRKSIENVNSDDGKKTGAILAETCKSLVFFDALAKPLKWNVESFLSEVSSSLPLAEVNRDLKKRIAVKLQEALPHPEITIDRLDRLEERWGGNIEPITTYLGRFPEANEYIAELVSGMDSESRWKAKRYGPENPVVQKQLEGLTAEQISAWSTDSAANMSELVLNEAADTKPAHIRGLITAAVVEHQHIYHPELAPAGPAFMQNRIAEIFNATLPEGADADHIIREGIASLEADNTIVNNVIRRVEATKTKNALGELRKIFPFTINSKNENLLKGVCSLSEAKQSADARLLEAFKLAKADKQKTILLNEADLKEIEMELGTVETGESGAEEQMALQRLGLPENGKNLKPFFDRRKELQVAINILRLATLSSKEITSGALLRGKGDKKASRKMSEVLIDLKKFFDAMPPSPFLQDLNNIEQSLTESQSNPGTVNRRLAFVSTDNPQMLWQVGKYPLGSGSCQNYESGSYAQSLLGYVGDAHSKAVFLVDINKLSPEDQERVSSATDFSVAMLETPAQSLLEASVARTVLKLAKTETGHAVFLEPTYTVINKGDKSMNSSFDVFVQDFIARPMGVATARGGDGGSVTIPTSRNPAGQYEDGAAGNAGHAGMGIQKGTYKVPARFLSERKS